MTFLILFPNQLYDELVKQQLKQKQEQEDAIILIEEPLFFKRPPTIKMHKLRCAFTHATFHAFAELHSKRIKKVISYKEASSNKTLQKILLGNVNKQTKTIQCYHPDDFDVLDKYTSILGKNLTVLRNPHAFVFVMDPATTTLQSFKSNGQFFEHMKKKLGIDEDLPSSTDTENRKPLPETIIKTHVRQIQQPMYKNENHYKSAIAFVNEHFKDHIGAAELVEFTKLPLTRVDAVKHLNTFIKKRFKLFGDYQDAVNNRETLLFHSNISHLLNVGLLTPFIVFKAVQSYIKTSNKSSQSVKTLPMNAIEGFLRQLLGWREYMRYLYELHGRAWKKQYLSLSHMNKTKSIPDWYKATTGIDPIDGEIQKCLQTAWSHHIVRLMYFLSPLKMMGASPATIYKWFIEVVALDAYDWVMVTNILTMGAFVQGFTHKPYISSSNYMKTMSNYPINDKWTQTMDALFYNYIVRHKEPAYMRNLAAWKKKPTSEKTKLLTIANKYTIK